MSKINQDSLYLASNGKTECNGGLNKDDIVLYLNNIKYPIPSKVSREDLNDALKSVLVNNKGKFPMTSMHIPAPVSVPKVVPQVAPKVVPQTLYHPSGVINPVMLPSTKDLPPIGSKGDRLAEINSLINEFVTKLNVLSADLKKKGYEDIATEICKILLRKKDDGSTPLSIINDMIHQYIELSLSDPTLSSNKFISDRRKTLASLLGSLNNVTKNKCIPQGGTGSRELFADIEASIVEYKLMNIDIGTATPTSIGTTVSAPKKAVAAPKKAIAIQNK